MKKTLTFTQTNTYEVPVYAEYKSPTPFWDSYTGETNYNNYRGKFLGYETITDTSSYSIEVCAICSRENCLSKCKSCDKCDCYSVCCTSCGSCKCYVSPCRKCRSCKCTSSTCNA